MNDHDAHVIGLYVDRLPPAQPTLGELVERAMAASDALTSATYATDSEWARAEAASFSARSDLVVELMSMGLTRRQIDLLGKVL